MKDGNKKFILQLAIDTEFFHRAFANPRKVLWENSMAGYKMTDELHR